MIVCGPSGRGIDTVVVGVDAVGDVGLVVVGVVVVVVSGSLGLRTLVRGTQV